MEKKALQKVCDEVYQLYPPLRDLKPKVSKQGEDRYLLVFSKADKTPDGKTIQQIIRVVASDNGKILKTSMNR
jgi:hypothetical protein